MSDKRPISIGMQKRVLALLCATVLSAILTAGLWPFHSPKNQVSWLNLTATVFHIGKYKIILSPGASRIIGVKDGTPCAVEIWLQPDHSDIGGTILAFYKPENHEVAFSVYQSIDDLLLRRATVYGQRPAFSQWYVGHVFGKNKASIYFDQLKRARRNSLLEWCSGSGHPRGSESRVKT